MARRKYTEVEKEMMRLVSENLKSILAFKGITQKYISDRTGLPTSTISDYINARTLISMANLELISNALEVNKSDIYPIDGKGEAPVPQKQGRQEKEIILEDLMSGTLIYKGRKLTDEEKDRYIKMVQALLD